MKILLASDIHGQNRVVRFLRNVAEKYLFDSIIISGDLAGWKDPESVFGVFGELAKFNGKVICVPGNSDYLNFLDISRDYSNMVMLHGQSFKMENIIFSGVGGMQEGTDHGSFLSLPESELYSMSMKAFQREDGKFNITISHVPPYKIQDYTRYMNHAGSRGILRFIKEAQPDVHVCGHIHENPGISKVGDTTVINPGNLKINDRIFYITVREKIEAGYVKYGDYEKLNEI